MNNYNNPAQIETTVQESPRLKTLKTILKAAKFLSFFAGGLSTTFLFRLLHFPGVWLLYWVAAIAAIVGIGFYQIQLAENQLDRRLIALGLAVSIPLSHWDYVLLTAIKPVFFGGALIPQWLAAVASLMLILLIAVGMSIALATQLNQIKLGQRRVKSGQPPKIQ